MFYSQAALLTAVSILGVSAKKEHGYLRDHEANDEDYEYKYVQCPGFESYGGCHCNLWCGDDDDFLVRPEWCKCDEAMACCENDYNTPGNAVPSKVKLHVQEGDEANDEDYGYKYVQCPGSSQKCRCNLWCFDFEEDDWLFRPEFCQCDEAKACCENDYNTPGNAVPSKAKLHV